MKTKDENTKAIDYLFEDFYRIARGTFEDLEAQYGVNGLCEQVFGTQGSEEAEKAHLRESDAWRTLSELYDYAINGVEPKLWDGTSSAVIAAGEVLSLATSENYRPTEEWFDVVEMGDGRYALDDGMALSGRQVALLGSVDIRTVRNAVSNGDLIAYKDERRGETVIDNGSARRWLNGRRGFKPTVIDSTAGDVDEITSAAEFGAFLKERRKHIGAEGSVGNTVVAHPDVTPEALLELEAGIFALPLDTVFPIADFYVLDRKKLLRCVMRVFFVEELQVLAEENRREVE